MPSKYKAETKDFESFDKSSSDELNNKNGEDLVDNGTRHYPCLGNVKKLKIHAKILEAFDVQPST